MSGHRPQIDVGTVWEALNGYPAQNKKHCLYQAFIRMKKCLPHYDDSLHLDQNIIIVKTLQK